MHGVAESHVGRDEHAARTYIDGDRVEDACLVLDHDRQAEGYPRLRSPSLPGARAVRIREEVRCLDQWHLLVVLGASKYE